MLKGILIKLFVYMRGIRFYTTERATSIQQFKKSVFETVDGRLIQFFFYKETYLDYVRKYNTIKEVKHVAYSICMKMDDDMPVELKQYNNLKIVFEYDFALMNCEDILDRELLLQYMNFLEKLMTKKQSSLEIPIYP